MLFLAVIQALLPEENRQVFFQKVLQDINCLREVLDFHFIGSDEKLVAVQADVDIDGRADDKIVTKENYAAISRDTALNSVLYGKDGKEGLAGFAYGSIHSLLFLEALHDSFVCSHYLESISRISSKVSLPDAPVPERILSEILRFLSCNWTIFCSMVFSVIILMTVTSRVWPMR